MRKLLLFFLSFAYASTSFAQLGKTCDEAANIKFICEKRFLVSNNQYPVEATDKVPACGDGKLDNTGWIKVYSDSAGGPISILLTGVDEAGFSVSVYESPNKKCDKLVPVNVNGGTNNCAATLVAGKITAKFNAKPLTVYYAMIDGEKGNTENYFISADGAIVKFPEMNLKIEPEVGCAADSFCVDIINRSDDNGLVVDYELDVTFNVEPSPNGKPSKPNGGKATYSGRFPKDSLITLCSTVPGTWKIKLTSRNECFTTSPHEYKTEAYAQGLFVSLDDIKIPCEEIVQNEWKATAKLLPRIVDDQGNLVVDEEITQWRWYFSDATGKTDKIVINTSDKVSKVNYTFPKTAVEPYKIKVEVDGRCGTAEDEKTLKTYKPLVPVLTTPAAVVCEKEISKAKPIVFDISNFGVSSLSVSDTVIWSYIFKADSTLSGQGNRRISLSNVPIGTHRIHAELFDKNGCSDTTSIIFKVIGQPVFKLDSLGTKNFEINCFGGGYHPGDTIIYHYTIKDVTTGIQVTESVSGQRTNTYRLNSPGTYTDSLLIIAGKDSLVGLINIRSTLTNSGGVCDTTVQIKIPVFEQQLFMELENIKNPYCDASLPTKWSARAYLKQGIDSTKFPITAWTWRFEDANRKVLKTERVLSNSYTNSYNYAFPASAPKPYYVYAEVEGACGSDDDIEKITFYQPIAPILSISQDTILCVYSIDQNSPLKVLIKNFSASKVSDYAQVVWSSPTLPQAVVVNDSTAHFTSMSLGTHVITVTASDKNGCSATSSIKVTAVPQPRYVFDGLSKEGLKTNCAGTGYPVGTTVDFYYSIDQIQTNIERRVIIPYLNIDKTLPIAAGTVYRDTLRLPVRANGGYGTIQIISQDQSGGVCFYDTTIIIPKLPEPTLAVKSSIDTVICTNIESVGICLEVLKSKGTVSYSWKQDGAVLSSETTNCLKLSGLSRGREYNFEVKAKDASCDTTINYTVFISKLPDVKIDIVSLPTVTDCQGNKGFCKGDIVDIKYRVSNGAPPYLVTFSRYTGIGTATKDSTFKVFSADTTIFVKVTAGSTVSPAFITAQDQISGTKCHTLAPVNLPLLPYADVIQTSCNGMLRGLEIGVIPKCPEYLFDWSKSPNRDMIVSKTDASKVTLDFSGKASGKYYFEVLVGNGNCSRLIGQTVEYTTNLADTIVTNLGVEGFCKKDLPIADYFLQATRADNLFNASLNTYNWASLTPAKSKALIKLGTSTTAQRLSLSIPAGTAPGDYTFNLIVTDTEANRCKDTLSYVVRIVDSAIITIKEKQKKYCGDGGVELEADGSFTGKYVWRMLDRTTNKVLQTFTEQSEIVKLPITKKGLYRFSASDRPTSGCVKADTIDVEVIEKPVFKVALVYSDNVLINCPIGGYQNGDLVTYIYELSNVTDSTEVLVKIGNSLIVKQARMPVFRDTLTFRYQGFQPIGTIIVQNKYEKGTACDLSIPITLPVVKAELDIQLAGPQPPLCREVLTNSWSANVKLGAGFPQLDFKVDSWKWVFEDAAGFKQEINPTPDGSTTSKVNFAFTSGMVAPFKITISVKAACAEATKVIPVLIYEPVKPVLTISKAKTCLNDITVNNPITVRVTNWSGNPSPSKQVIWAAATLPAFKVLNDSTIQFTSGVAGKHTISATLVDTKGCDEVATIDVEILPQPKFEFDGFPEPLKTNCAGKGYQLNDQITYNYSIKNVPSDVQVSILVPSNGINKIFTVKAGTAEFKDSFKIKVFGETAAGSVTIKDLGSTAECNVSVIPIVIPVLPDSLRLTSSLPVKTCINQTSQEICVTPAGYHGTVKFEWLGDPLVNGKKTNCVSLTGLQTGKTYSFSVKVTDDFCTQTLNYELNVNKPPVVQLVNESPTTFQDCKGNKGFCEKDHIKAYKVKVSGGVPPYKIRVVIPTESIDQTFTVNEAAGEITIPEFIVYELSTVGTVTVTDAISSGVCAATLPITIPLLPFADVKSVNCASSTEQILEIIPQCPNYKFDWAISADKALIVGPTNGSSVKVNFRGKPSGTYNFSVKVFGETCNRIIDIPIKYSDILPDSLASGDRKGSGVICVGNLPVSSYPIRATRSTGGFNPALVEFDWTQTPDKSKALIRHGYPLNLQDILLDLPAGLEKDVYRFFVNVKEKGNPNACTIKLEFALSIIDNTDLTFKFGSDTLCMLKENTIKVQGNLSSLYRWTRVEPTTNKVIEILDNNGPELKIKFDEFGDYKYFIEEVPAVGCINGKYLDVKVDQCDNFKIPNIFTPNGDGANETFTVEGIADRGWKMIINNRHGKEIYKSDNYKNDWDAQGFPDGTYFFELTSPTGRLVFKGWVVVAR